jgi:hypothetical protein
MSAIPPPGGKVTIDIEGKATQARVERVDVKLPNVWLEGE